MPDLTENNKNILILSLREIAWWWLGDAISSYPSENKDHVWADLPVIQRGFVWHANKIERLWDSIATGFPIGSLMLHESEPDSEMMKKHGADKSVENVRNRSGIKRFFLLDGQQRATSIALGFKDIWSNAEEDSYSKEVDGESWKALWVDIGWAPKDDRSFLFRLISNAHPWGYSRNVSATSTPVRLSASDMRNAHQSFKICADRPGDASLKPYQVPAHLAFPWDADAPVPLAFVLNGLMQSNGSDLTQLKRTILEKMQQLPVMRHLEDMESSNDKNHVKQMFQNVYRILGTWNNDSECTVFQSLANNLRIAINEARIAAPVLRLGKYTVVRKFDAESTKPDELDPDFNLFARINTAGTALTAEEINYSLLKSAWKEASTKIDGALEKRQITSPAKLVSLLSRLVLTSQSIKSGKPKFRDRLTIAQFRQEISGKDRSDSEVKKLEDLLKDFFDTRKSDKLLDTIWKLLTGAGERQDKQEQIFLPKILAANITRSSEDLILVILIWLQALLEQFGDSFYDKLTAQDRAKTLGFITSVHWFALDPDRCARTLGEELVKIVSENPLDENRLINFFGNENYGRLKKPDGNKPAPMRDLPNPKRLSKFLDSSNTDSQKPYLWHIYFDKWEYSTNLAEFLEQSNPIQDRELVDATYNILNKIITDRRLLFYAQRSFVNEMFAWFDPTKVDRITDHDVPWDLDHIVPYSWLNAVSHDLGSEIPNKLKIWRESNGNFRVWPAEANRSKGNETILENNLNDYGLRDVTAICGASAISNMSWFMLNAKMKKNDFKDEKLKEFIGAAMIRTIDIYKNWYITLLLDLINE
ncbi:DUF262 domain-containing protein [Acidithiobacillus sp.]